MVHSQAPLYGSTYSRTDLIGLAFTWQSLPGHGPKSLWS